MEAVKHSNRKHALLSASGSSRWLNCTPSPRVEEKIETADGEENVYAAEGTLAHEFGDIGLQFLSKQISKAKYDAQFKKLKKNELYSTEMDDEVEKYTSYVMEQFHVADVKTNGAILLIEEKVDLTHYIEDGFGTDDAIVIADGVMEIIDLKYGKGVQVFAKENSQLKLYGLGTLREYELLYDVHTVRLTIVQPRLNHIDSWDISTEDLIKWGENIVKPAAEKAYAGEGIQKAGEWCRWCKANVRCSTLASQNMKVAKHEFKDPHLLTDARLIQVYNKMPQISIWIKAVSEYLLKEAIKGKNWPGLKVVAGRSNRIWIDSDEAIAILKSKRFRKDEYINSKLKGIGDIEKLVGKDQFNELFALAIAKPEGKPTLVDESDKRPGIGIAQAKADFST